MTPSADVCATVRAHMQARFGLRHDQRERLAAGIDDAARSLGITARAVSERVRSHDVEAALLASLTTPESYFLRQPDQLSWVFDAIAPRADPVRIWSAGCARGEEPYSLAILAIERFGAAARARVRIVGSDINAEAIRRARAGEYRAWSFRGVDERVQRRFFDAATCDAGRPRPAPARWSIKPEVRACVRFTSVNLARPDAAWPTAQDVIFCRNVLLYLDATTFASVLAALHERLGEAGVLVVSPAEAPFVKEPFVAVAGAPTGVFRVQPSRPSTACEPRFSGTGGALRPHIVDALPSPPSGPEQALARAYALANRGLAARAMETVEALLGEHPLFAAGYLARAILRLEAGAEAQARADLARARRLDPTLSLAALFEGKGSGCGFSRSDGSREGASAEVDAVELASLHRTLQRLEATAASKGAADD